MAWINNTHTHAFMKIYEWNQEKIPSLAVEEEEFVGSLQKENKFVS